MRTSIEPAAPPLSPELVALIRGANDASLDLAAVAGEKLFQPGRDGATSTLVSRIDGEMAGVAASCGRYLRVLAVARHMRRRGVGTALLRRVVSLAADRGMAGLVVGAEPGNYFLPGIESTDSGALAFFATHGFTRSSDAVNLVASTHQKDPDPALQYRLASPADSDAARQFVMAEFGRGWMFEVENALRATPPGLVLAFRGGDLLGFAGIDVVNRGLGTFGPAGVARKERGTGAGRGILLASLRELRNRGYDRCIIQWAAALPFYEKSAGATVLAHYEILTRKIGADSDRVKSR